jgi:nucleoside-diphosphate-sugar epimerase
MIEATEMEANGGGLLVIGARSLVGRRLREAVLGENGWPGEVRFTSRRPLSGQSLILDFNHIEAFDPGFKFSTVILCTPVWLASESLLNHLFALGMRRLIAFSSTSLFTKDTSDTPEEREVVHKLAVGEKSIIDYCSGRGVAWTVFRPTLIYDEGHDQNVSQIAGMIRKLGFFPICAPAKGLRQPVHGRDLAKAALQAIPAQGSFNKAYNLTGGDSLTYRAMVERIFAGLGRKPVIVALPQWLWRAGFGLLDVVRPKRALKRNVNMVLRMNQDLWFDTTPARRDFGYTPEAFKPDFGGVTRVP